MIAKDDAVVLAHLRENGRVKLSAISQSTGIPISTLFEKVSKKLARYISRHACILNNEALGFGSRATIILKVDKEQKADIGAFLQKHPNVNSLFKINNGYDFMLDAIFRHMADLEAFIESLESKYKIRHKEVYFIISEVKQESFMASQQDVALLLKQYPEGSY